NSRAAQVQFEAAGRLRIPNPSPNDGTLRSTAGNNSETRPGDAASHHPYLDGTAEMRPCAGPGLDTALMLSSNKAWFWPSTESQWFICSALVLSCQCPNNGAASPNDRRSAVG